MMVSRELGFRPRPGGRGNEYTELTQALESRMPTETPWTHSTVFICYYRIGATQTARSIARPTPLR
jgi:hypothetical protein